MAIDSAEKRKSVAGLPYYIFGPGVTPDASQDVEWRAESGWGYSGIMPDPPPPSSGSDNGMRYSFRYRYGWNW